MSTSSNEPFCITRAIHSFAGLKGQGILAEGGLCLQMWAQSQNSIFEKHEIFFSSTMYLCLLLCKIDNNGTWNTSVDDHSSRIIFLQTGHTPISEPCSFGNMKKGLEYKLVLCVRNEEFLHIGYMS